MILKDLQARLMIINKTLRIVTQLEKNLRDIRFYCEIFNKN
jgi:hypothetical protein